MKPPLRRCIAAYNQIAWPFYAVMAALAAVPGARAAEKISFNRDIRPILSDKCFTCHGPDADKRKGELRLDERASALKGGKSELPSVVPGKPDESELIKRVTTSDADDHMPPKKGGKELKSQEVTLLRQWIAEGANYQGHWAFTAPVRPALAGGAGQPAIDGFVAARMAKDGLKLAPEADKATLLRRLSLDLTGLPPTLAELDAFLADNAANAYEKQVDRLMASPRYGERMAIQWLDFARYADSNGFQSDSSRQMSLWRDWVIKAFNSNQPFDQFTIEQLAGDLLPKPTQDQIVATGFNRNHRLNGEGGRIVEEWFAENIIDRLETTSGTWLALTVGCARCHDHKFDPISQKEFYQLFAIFNSIDESGVLVTKQGNASALDGTNTEPVATTATPAQIDELAKIDGRIAAAKAELKKIEANGAAARSQWEKAVLAGEAAAWTVLEPSEVLSANGATLTKEAEGVVVSSGAQPAVDTYTVQLPVNLPIITAVRLELLADERLPAKGPGRHANGNPVISELRLSVTDKNDGSQRELGFGEASADFSQKGWEIAKVIDGKPDTGWAIEPQQGKEHAAILSLKEALHLEKSGGVLNLQIDQKFGGGSLLGKFRVSVTGAAAPQPVPANIVEILKVEAGKRKPPQKKKLEEFYAARGGAAADAKAKVAVIEKERSALTSGIASTMVMRELAKPREAHILIRGQYDKLGEKVERGLPAALPPLPKGAPMNRLGFAKWLVSGEHPLTARVWVNRAWEKFFGYGLVKSSENFGSQADWPSHPELLDWLACEFMKPSQGVLVNGKPAAAWDMKALQKLIVTSATYRQSARATPAQIEHDPDNRLLARGPRFRLGAEALRDSALAVSGLLVEKIGGRSVRPYMPKGVWDETSVYGDLLNYKNDTGEGLYRRTLYTIWKRTAAPPTALMFDAPSREICTVKRSRTNTPLQALALLNEVTYVEAARKLAERMILEGGKSPEERLRWAFRRVTSRPPNAGELGILKTGLEGQLARFGQDSEAAAKLVAFGETKSPSQIPAAELAAYTVSANVLMNLDEFVSR